MINGIILTSLKILIFLSVKNSEYLVEKLVNLSIVYIINSLIDLKQLNIFIFINVN